MDLLPISPRALARLDPTRGDRSSLSPDDATDIYTAQQYVYPATPHDWPNSRCCEPNLMQDNRYTGENYNPFKVIEQLHQNAVERRTLRAVQARKQTMNSIDGLPKQREPASSAPIRAPRFPFMPTPSPTKHFFVPRPRRESTFKPDLSFERLPQATICVILQQLEDLHEDKLVSSCSTCYMRDLVSLQLTCRAWDRAVTRKL